MNVNIEYRSFKPIARRWLFDRVCLFKDYICSTKKLSHNECGGPILDMIYTKTLIKTKNFFLGLA